MPAELICSRLGGPGRMPTAWMGRSPKDMTIVRVCSYCPDKALADVLAANEGLRVSHSICPPCFQEQQEREHP